MSNLPSTIILDPGHGLENGAYSRPLIDITNGYVKIINDYRPTPQDNLPGYYREDLGTLIMAKLVAAELECMGHKVFLTRNNNKSCASYLSQFSQNEWKKKFWPGWKWVKQLTIDKKADLLVSLHTNAFNRLTSGCAGFYANPPGEKVCQHICTSLNKELGLKTRRIEKKRFLVLRDSCKGASALIEYLFHDNFSDVSLVMTDAGRMKVAATLAGGINSFLQKG